MRCLHIFYDDKFVDIGIKNFQEYDKTDTEHTFLAIKGKHKLSLSYVKSIDAVPITFYRLLFNIILRQYRGYDCLIFHSFPQKSKIISRFMNRNLCRVWIGWGADYYVYYKEQVVLDYVGTNVTSNSFRDLIKKTSHRMLAIEKEVKEIDFFCPVLNSEFEIFKDIFSEKIKFSDWNYGSFNSFQIKSKTGKLGNSILMGNSATPENNHLSIIKLLNGQDTLIHVPLNYGDDEYKKWIVNKIEEHNLNVDILSKYLSKDEYLTVLMDCNILIFNHIRQQGAGNVGLAFLLGITVYLNEKSPLYKDFENMGFAIKRTQILTDTKPCVLESHLLEENTVLAGKIFNRDNTMTKTKNLIHDLLKHKGSV